MLVYAVDLGTTNLKVVLFDAELRALAVAREPMAYTRSGPRVEFDAEAVVDAVLALVRRCAADAAAPADEPAVIVVTGQAESLVLADPEGRAIAPGISWMDERSHAEAEEITAEFGARSGFAITGEPEAVATWPATKLRWLSRHAPDLLAAASHVLMIKDFVLLRLSGRAVGEETTRGFTYLYDVERGAYWDDMLAFCGVDPATLPELVPAGTDLGPVRPELRDALPPAASYTVNAGALDHFCAMVGTDAYRAGEVHASAGTVLSLSLLAEQWTFDGDSAVSFHRGIRPGEIVLFSCADSGGVALEWYRELTGAVDYAVIERELPARDVDDAPIFLPYLTGLNPPDFNPAARGAFVDLQLRHDQVDLTHAVMEGVAHLLRRNIDDFVSHGHPVREIVSAGGGTASPTWNRLKADATGIDLRTSAEPEAAARGAAVLALVAAGVLADVTDTTGLVAPRSHHHRAQPSPHRARRYARFVDALTRLYGSRPEENPS